MQSGPLSEKYKKNVQDFDNHLKMIQKTLYGNLKADLFPDKQFLQPCGF